MNSADIAKAIKMGKGKMLKTVSGGTLTAWMKGKKLYITDEKEVCHKSYNWDANQVLNGDILFYQISIIVLNLIKTISAD
jgi:hypothetical protein